MMRVSQEVISESVFTFPSVSYALMADQITLASASQGPLLCFQEQNSGWPENLIWREFHQTMCSLYGLDSFRHA